MFDFMQMGVVGMNVFICMGVCSIIGSPPPSRSLNTTSGRAKRTETD